MSGFASDDECIVLEIWTAMDIICHLEGHVLHFYHPNNPENQNFEKLKITHVKKVGQTSYFFLAFINELEEEIIIKKTAEMGQ